jgi:hypothetical protein
MPDGKFAHFHFDNPVTFLPNQKFFGVRTKDLHDLRTYAPLFHAALAGTFWKFRMAIDMYQSGFLKVQEVSTAAPWLQRSG